MYLAIFEKEIEHFKFKNYKRIIPVNKLNILIGANNSGKSYFLREIMANLIGVMRYDQLILEFEKQYDNIFSVHNFDYDIFQSLYKSLSQKEIAFLNNLSANITTIINNTQNVHNNLSYSGPVSNSTIYVDEDKTIKEEKIIVSIYNKLFNENVSIPNKGTIGNFVNVFLPKMKTMLDDLIKGEIKEYVMNNLKERAENIYLLFSLFEFIGSLFKMEENDSRLLSSLGKYQTRVFIPPIRTLRHPLKVDDDMFDYRNNVFKNRLVKEYDLNTDDIDIFTGLDFYKKYKEKLLGDKKDRKNIKEFEEKVSKIFFGGKDLTIIPNEATHELKISIDGEEDIELCKVGDGISQIILILYTLIVENKRYVFIEEPELSLHPGYQVLLSKILSSDNYFQDKFIFITTHSNHIIDRNIGFDDNKQLLKVNKENAESFKVTKICNNDASILTDLGVSPSSVFLANKTIFVEGKYDALYIRHLLETDDNFKKIEGLDYVFIPYGGSSRVLYEHDQLNYEIERVQNSILNINNITNDYIFIMDDDGIDENKNININNAKENFYNNLNEKIGHRLIKLDVHEIENLVSKETIIEYLVKKSDESNRTKITEFINSDNGFTYQNIKLEKFFEQVAIDLNIEFRRKDLDKSLMYQLFLKEDNTTFTEKSLNLRDKISDFINDNG